MFDSISLFVGCFMPAHCSELSMKNWLKCDGRAVSRTEYSRLFDVIGTYYGIGDGSTTFNLPNLSGCVIRGFVSGTLGETIGSDKIDVKNLPLVNDLSGIDMASNPTIPTGILSIDVKCGSGGSGAALISTSTPTMNNDFIPTAKQYNYYIYS